MDEEVKVNQITPIPWDIEDIDNDQIVYRQIPASQRTGTRPKCYPSEAHFSLRDEEDSLSFNWAKYIDLAKNFSLIAITANSKGKLGDYTGYNIFKYAVNFLSSISRFKSINHTPVFNGNPSPIGLPNNKSHVSLFFDENDLSVRIQLSDYCNENYEFCKCEFDVKSLKEEIEALRERGNDTPYHNLWVFNEN